MKTRVISIGDKKIGGGNPILIQSMTNTDTRDVKATVSQIKELTDAGCDIVRVAIPDEAAARAVSYIKKEIEIPLVCDIHFDYRLALICMEQGADKIRINPGNIGDEDKVLKVVSLAKEKNIPIRIGVNSGSLRKEQLEKYGKVTAQGLFESALYEVSLFEKYGYENLCVSIKASDVLMCIKAYTLFSMERDYPLHLGITEAGTVLSGSIKSALGLGIMLNSGIGDTIRVSLTGDPVMEVTVAKQILSDLGLRQPGVTIVSCPTCGRTQIDLIRLANEVEEYAKTLKGNLKIAVMGCAVNGPGEAREADIGIAGGHGDGLIFKKGQIIKKVPENMLLYELKKELKAYEQ